MAVLAVFFRILLCAEGALRHKTQNIKRHTHTRVGLLVRGVEDKNFKFIRDLQKNKPPCKQQRAK